MLTYLRRKKKKGGNNNINKIKLNKTVHKSRTMLKKKKEVDQFTYKVSD